MAKKTKITYRWVRDPEGDFAHSSRSTGLPDTLLLNTSGEVLARKRGAFASEGELTEWISSNLE